MNPAIATAQGAEQPILEVNGLTKRYGAVVAVDEASVRVGAGTIHALIGPNGAGKSTLFSLIAGPSLPPRVRSSLMGRR